MSSRIDLEAEFVCILHDHLAKKTAPDLETRMETTYPGYKRDLVDRIDALLDQSNALKGALV